MNKPSTAKEEQTTKAPKAESREEVLADAVRQLKALARGLTKWHLTPEEREAIVQHVKVNLG